MPTNSNQNNDHLNEEEQVKVEESTFSTEPHFHTEIDVYGRIEYVDDD